MVTAVAMGLAISFSNLEDSLSAPIAFLLSRLDNSFSTKSYNIGECQNLLHQEFWDWVLESIYEFIIVWS